ncbi:MAG: glucose-6-phosphate isomerase [Planctomycetes bacterium]|nr:glucose-6-phosphate isomerase [Planctomycetota bacterium]
MTQLTTALTIDFAGCLADRVGDAGLDLATLDDAAPRLRTLTEELEATCDTGLERWRSLPHDPVRAEHLSAVDALVTKLAPGTDDLIVLGIGGSALGNSALQAALNPPTWNLLPREKRGGPRLFVLDNVDPVLVGRTLACVRETDPRFERTVLNVVSKSGETAETAAQFLVARSMLVEALGDAHAERVVAITDTERGTMRSICDAEGYATLPVPGGVGGRFSVLSPVGLFSSAMCGIDVAALLDGAAEMDERCRRPEVRENPAALLAWLLIEHARHGRSQHVLMPYANALDGLADWYRQLWAESLGKRQARDGREIFAGPTPIKALGATDQHSQIQLYREGPADKVIGFVEVERFAEDVAIPGDLDVEPLRYLHGKSLGALLAAEKRATEYALVESRRPHYTIRMPEITAHTIGQFIWLWQMTTAYAGLLLDVNAYDQPAVETGKQATFGLMGREGYEEWAGRVEGALRGG